MLYFVIIVVLIGVIIFLIQRLNLQKSYYEYKSSKLDSLETTYEKEVTELTTSVHDLHKTAYTNTITNIGNLDYFMEQTASEFEHYPDSHFTLISFGISNMVKVNQLYGPTEGDNVLIHTANLLRHSISGNYLYAHVQSNLFSLMLKDYNSDAVISIIHEITAALMSYSTNFAVTSVFGIYEVEDCSMQLSDMLNCTVLAQKAVPPLDKQNYAYFTEDLNKTFVENKKMSLEMEKALEDHKLIMYLQPMIDLHTYQIISAEALVRWAHPEKGILSPYAFLPLFESTKLMLKLDYYMWEEACKTVRHWIDNKLEPIPVTINISPVHLNNHAFIETLSKLTDQYKLSKKMLVLELPERGLINASEDVYAIVTELSEVGFLLCIDNFGSTHSPVNLLKDLPITYVKLDRKFLSQNTSSEEGLTILRYLIAIAKELDLIVITEGVETLKQANFLTEIGCDTAQGFFFSKPVDLRAFDQLNKKMLFTGYQPNEYYPTFKDMEKGVDIMEKMLTP